MTAPDSRCPGTDCTGYLPGGAWCTCDARPFPLDGSEPARRAVAPRALTRAEHGTTVAADQTAHTQATIAIDLLMAWSSNTLGRIASLGTLSYHAEHQAFDVVAPRLLAELDRLEAGVAHLPAIIAHARAAALAALGEGEPA